MTVICWLALFVVSQKEKGGGGGCACVCACVCNPQLINKLLRSIVVWVMLEFYFLFFSFWKWKFADLILGDGGGGIFLHTILLEGYLFSLFISSCKKLKNILFFYISCHANEINFIQYMTDVSMTISPWTLEYTHMLFVKM